MKNKRIILERVKVKELNCVGCIFDTGIRCFELQEKFDCLINEQSYIWKEVKQKKEAKNANSEKE